jgi:hypothetical protein
MKSDGLYTIDDAGLVTGPLGTGGVTLDPDSSTRNIILPTGGDYIPLILRGYASAQTANLFEVKEGSAGTDVMTISGTGDFLFQPFTDATTAFQILDKDGGTPIFNIDSTNERVGIGTASPSYTFQTNDAKTGTLGGYGSALDMTWTPGGASANNYGAMWVKSQFDGSDNSSGYITGIEVLCDILGTGATSMRGLDIYCWNDNTGTVANADGIYIENIEAFGGGSITTSRALYIDGQTGATNSYAIVTNAGKVVFNEGGHAEADIRIETDTEPNFVYVDTGAEWIRFGDWDTNYVEIDKAGDICFVGGGGLPIGEIYVKDNATATTITSSGEGNAVQVTIFDTNGASPDHTNDHITITKAGFYKCTITGSLASVGASGVTIGMIAKKNNGATALNNVHTERRLSGGGGDTGSFALHGYIDCAVNDTIEFWAWNATNTDNVLFSDVCMTVEQVMGT